MSISISIDQDSVSRIVGENREDELVGESKRNDLQYKIFKTKNGFVYEFPSFSLILASCFFIEKYDILKAPENLSIDSFPRVLCLEHGIRNPIALYEYLISVGFYDKADDSASLSLLKIEELKAIAKKYDLAVSGKKKDLVDRIVKKAPDLQDDLPFSCYAVSENGKSWFKENAEKYEFLTARRDYGTFDRFLKLRDEPTFYCQECGTILDLETQYCPFCEKICKEPLTDVMFANTARDRKTALDIGSVCYRWVASKDQRTRQSHRDMDGVIVFWMPKEKRPLLDGVRGDAGEFEGCRCDVRAINFPISDDLGNEKEYRVYDSDTDSIVVLSKKQLVEKIRERSSLDKQTFDMYLKDIYNPVERPIFTSKTEEKPNRKNRKLFLLVAVVFIVVLLYLLLKK